MSNDNAIRVLTDAINVSQNILGALDKTKADYLAKKATAESELVGLDEKRMEHVAAIAEYQKVLDTLTPQDVTPDV
ncbi:hypothetical protein [Microbacterium sp. PRC9]|uniref:hypothetical protein n=1 Tax=Microbacterium sp. PRC9 TaxID=2962591 RepID=UPI002881248C|nr:hypothetical protein [Microbacterium sp. PRC9]MDT0142787.1 hypothetical protein [Microbacterium sp. PRC9]